MNRLPDHRGLQDTQTILKMYLEQVIREGDIVIDATAGRGRDTLFLARCVGVTGKVFAFDIQEEAILATRELLENFGLADRVELLHKSHTSIADHVHDRVKAVVFNLGYLPGGGNRIITQAATTVEAVQQGLTLLEEKGIIALTVYRGHEGGQDESQKLTSFLSGLSKKDFSVVQGIYLNQGELSPYWIMIQKNRRTIDENPPSEKDPGTDSE
ncbi:MAG: methyltransferase domain-containing protein [Peptococcaceae bacterium]|nr:methyltransferase domain-containing protein [Peptococcaceae bacterium]